MMLPHAYIRDQKVVSKGTMFGKAVVIASTTYVDKAQVRYI